MPFKPPALCAHPGCCRRPVAGSAFCIDHRKRRERDREYDKRRGSSASRGYGAAWAKVRDEKLTMNPRCELCGDEAKHVHHINAKRDGGSDDLVNLQSLCAACHNKQHPERGHR